jgi:hypothetical protein
VDVHLEKLVVVTMTEDEAVKVRDELAVLSTLSARRPLDALLQQLDDLLG